MAKKIVVKSDSFFRIGQAHVQEGLPCQDYATTYETDLLATACIADGCSASFQSEIGAMFNVLFWRKYIAIQTIEMQGGTPYGPHGSALNSLYRMCALDFQRAVPVDVSDQGHPFDATLVAAIYDISQDTIQVVFYGDGCIITKFRDPDGEEGYLLETIHWTPGMPPYLSYLLERERLTALETRYQKFPVQGVKTSLEIKSESSKMLDADVYLLKDVLNPGGAFASIGAGWRTKRVDPETGRQILSVSVCSDGATDIRSINAGNLWEETPRNWISSFVQFPNTSPNFQTRRCLRAFPKLQSEGFLPVDDFSIATLVFEEIDE